MKLEQEYKKSVAIIGCGASGLPALKHFSEDPLFNCVAFEQADNVGGTWVYTDQIGTDKYGLPVHSSMYKSLRTNLPKEIMELPGFPHKGPEDKSYVTANDMLKYLEDYAEHFGLIKFIKFHHHIKEVSPLEGDRWQVTIIDLKTKLKATMLFDGVIVCVGNYSNPVIPNIPGIENFQGLKIHSHDYRDSLIFKDKKTLVIGCGPSGLDISFDIAKTASKVYLSHHNKKIKNMKCPPNMNQKVDVKKILNNGVLFEDDSFETVDSILYCTGYTYKYPFLSPECGIRVENNNVKILFKHIVNIEHPTMFFIGIPTYTTGFCMYDLQVRFAKKILSGTKQLPKKKEMLKDTHRDVESRMASGLRQKELHMMYHRSMEYFQSLAIFADLEPIPPVILQIFFDGFDRFMCDFSHFREDKYKLLDNEHYMVQFPNEVQPIMRKQEIIL
ncbi:senecionine N-oxygenase-like isoform X2 [Daktulosphaira vitifoliae]|uniref:senecionine N-oxygenase-like isoform X2 n=1 Tax=Daktulosphaira vitifoliae TaxID=58002 RepID=UPI0021A9D0A5|nr:senecionine N-oxygenase-like isoform X2 [Daktulosphaira vitifoliae]